MASCGPADRRTSCRLGKPWFLGVVKAEAQDRAKGPNRGSADGRVAAPGTAAGGGYARAGRVRKAGARWCGRSMRARLGTGASLGRWLGWVAMRLAVGAGGGCERLREEVEGGRPAWSGENEERVPARVGAGVRC